MKILKVIEYTSAYRTSLNEGSIALYKSHPALIQLTFPHYMYE